MVGDNDSESSTSSSNNEDPALAAFSLVKFENPEVVDIEDPVLVDKDSESCEELLNSILPPREWEHNGKLWRQRVSASPATRLDVMNLQEQLDQKLQQRQARETGICQVIHTVQRLCIYLKLLVSMKAKNPIDNPTKLRNTNWIHIHKYRSNNLKNQ